MEHRYLVLSEQPSIDGLPGMWWVVPPSHQPMPEFAESWRCLILPGFHIGAILVGSVGNGKED